LRQSRPRRGRRQSSGPQTKQPAHLSRIKTTQDHNAERKTYFFNAIDPKRTSKGLPRIDSGAPYNPKFHRHFSAISSSNQF
jgi:hypothetical protein